MRKITFLIALFACSIGFSQSGIGDQEADRTSVGLEQKMTSQNVVPVEDNFNSDVLSNVQMTQNQSLIVNDVTNNNTLTGVFKYDQVTTGAVTNGNATHTRRTVVHTSNTSRNSGVVDPYTDLATFQANVAGALTSEIFDGGPGGITACGPLINSDGDGTCYAPGELEEGFDMTASNATDVIHIGSGQIGNTSILVGANTFAEFTIITFTGDPVFEVGHDVWNNSDPDTDYRVFDTGGLLIQSFNLNNTVGTENFFGVISPVEIGHIEIDGLNASGELIGNLLFTAPGGGGGGGGTCDQANATPGGGVENGRGCSANNNWTAANDFIVAAGEDAEISSIIPNILVSPGATILSADVSLWDDAGGLPGTSLTTQAGVVPTSQPVIGSAFGLDLLAVTLDLTPLMLAGDAGMDTSYWISIQVTTSDGLNAFWEDNSVNVIGEFLAFENNGAGWTIPDVRDGVYTFVANCTPIGGGPCTPESLTTTFAGGNGNFGNMFDVNALTDITIDSFDIHGDTGATFDVEVYAKSGTYVGFETDAGAWTLIGTAPGVVSNGDGVATPLDLMLGYTMATGETHAFYVTPTDFGTGGFNYTNGTAVGNVFASDANMEFLEGAGSGYPFNGTLFSPRVFNGNIVYCVGGATATNDECAGATPVMCTDVIVGTTADNTDTGGNAAPDEWYSFTGTGTPQIVTLSLCDGGTDYDSLLRVFDSCGGTEIATNDDSCGLQSELTFLSDGTSTYLIMIEGFGSNSGNFSMEVTCVDPPPNDECAGAIDIACGETVVGETNTASFDASAPVCVTGITAPGVWYTFTDTTGLVTNYTLSMCDGGTDYDSKITVYSGDCGALACVVDNDDSCGLQSEVAFQGDGLTTYYILVHGFAANTGNFSLALDCAPVPPPNDMIVNSIDVDEIGFPYTDPAVAMPAATTEAGNPAGCNIDGANGVWYNFVPDGDGFATATITSPAGASFVNFFTAPDESATEDELTLVEFNGNQCAPQTDAIIPTTAGQAYYVFVVNTDGITDIVIDGNNLGVNDTAIQGFTYYPNPATDVLNLNAVDTIDNVAIYNILGQQVLNNDVAATSGTLDVSNLAVGAYIMKVSVNGEIGTYKIIKR